MSSVFVWFCVEVGGVSGAGAAASHLTALDPISLALLTPQVTAAGDAHHPPATQHAPLTALTSTPLFITKAETYIEIPLLITTINEHRVRDNLSLLPEKFLYNFNVCDE